jgi:hypothetical protein
LGQGCLMADLCVTLVSFFIKGIPGETSVPHGTRICQLHLSICRHCQRETACCAFLPPRARPSPRARSSKEQSIWAVQREAASLGGERHPARHFSSKVAFTRPFGATVTSWLRTLGSS